MFLAISSPNFCYCLMTIFDEGLIYIKFHKNSPSLLLPNFKTFISRTTVKSTNMSLSLNIYILIYTRSNSHIHTRKYKRRQQNSSSFHSVYHVNALSAICIKHSSLVILWDIRFIKWPTDVLSQSIMYLSIFIVPTSFLGFNINFPIFECFWSTWIIITEF